MKSDKQKLQVLKQTCSDLIVYSKTFIENGSCYSNLRHAITAAEKALNDYPRTPNDSSTFRSHVDNEGGPADA